MHKSVWLVPMVLAAGCAAEDGAAGGCPALTKPRSGGTSHGIGFSAETVDETWTAADSPHITSTRYLHYASLTIEPCAYVLLTNSASIEVARGGKLTAIGTEDQPIVFDTHVAEERWEGIETSYQASNGEPDDTIGGTVELAYVTLLGAGGAGAFGNDETPVLTMRGNDVQFDGTPLTEHIKVTHVTIDGGAGDGAWLTQGAGFAAGSTDLTVKNVAGYPVHTGMRMAGTVPVGTYTGNGIDAVFVRPETPLNRDMTLRDVGVPYRMSRDNESDDFLVGANPQTSSALTTLTIEPGVRLEFAKGNGLQILDNGVLVARGTESKPIVFTSPQATPAPGDWSGIAFRGAPLAANVVDGIVVEYAGGENDAIGRRCRAASPLSPGNGYGAISFDTRPASAFVKNTTLRDSLHDGFNRGWTGTPMDLSPTNTIVGFGDCKQSYPVPAVGECPEPVPCQ
jgi:hypothetical protein